MPAKSAAQQKAAGRRLVGQARRHAEEQAQGRIQVDGVIMSEKSSRKWLRPSRKGKPEHASKKKLVSDPEDYPSRVVARDLGSVG